MDLQVALLDASIGDTPARRNFRRELDAAVTAFKLSEGEFPDPVTASTSRRDWPFDAVVVSGSQTSVYWDEPWIPRIEQWVADAADAGVPILGVCWGHQLLAEALGGDVEPMDDYELGYHTIYKRGESRLLAGLPDSFVAFTTHSDAVTTLPSGATALADNEYALQAFARGNVFGVQFHPEYDMGTARSVTEGKDLPEERIQAVLDDITPERYREARAATGVFDNFLAIAAEKTVTARQ